MFPRDVRIHLPDHEVDTAEWAGFKNLRTGGSFRKPRARVTARSSLRTKVSLTNKTFWGAGLRFLLSDRERTKSKASFQP